MTARGSLRRPRGRFRLEVAGAPARRTDARRAENVVVQVGAELVAGLFAGVDGVGPIDTVAVGFGTEGADLGAKALTPPSDDRFDPGALRTPISKGDFALATDADARLVRVSVATAFHPTVELADVTEAGLLGGETLYNQVVFEPVTLRPGQDVTFFWEIDFPFGH